ncbi:MAG: 2OG-Fe(II) oxygenase [Hyphomicrobiales bacterium]|nr:2OG-Fe(II) oxygenase [Hyphomicrobiales bacterium]
MATEAQGVPASAHADHVMACIGRAQHCDAPFDYWLLDDVLPMASIDAIADLPFAPPDAPLFDGRRESNNSTRVYFNPEQQARFAVCRDVVAAFRDPAIIAALTRLTGSDVAKGHLRIEYCQDVDGFWLEPHLDISVKLFTMLVYLSGDPALRDAGTDIYDSTPEHRLVTSAPYEKNKGLIFIPGSNSWHGFSRRPIRGLRKSIIINYVTPAWQSRYELA